MAFSLIFHFMLDMGAGGDGGPAPTTGDVIWRLEDGRFVVLRLVP